MKLSGKMEGFALLCDANGTIRHWIRDDLDLANHYPAGQGLVRLVSRSERPKLLSFLVEVRTNGAAFNWALNLPIADQISTLHLAGAAADNFLLVVGANSSSGVLQLYEEMTQVNKEQGNLRRATAREREQAEIARSQIERDDVLYDQLSRLNNELVTLQRDMAKKNVELERLNRLKNQFLGMAAHDLRSPLAIIQTYSEFLLEEAAPKLDEEHLDFLSTIHGSSQFMLQLITDLLDVSTIESGKLALNVQPTELRELIERNVALNAVLAKKKQIEVRCRLPETPVQVTADPTKLEQVMNNLVTNAVKFSHPFAVVEIRVAAEVGRVVVSVADEGQGIPAAELDKLFQPFSKTSVQSTGGEKSAGLGLMIARKIVEGHGGEIWVESEVGRGSTFHFSLPLAAGVDDFISKPVQRDELPLILEKWSNRHKEDGV